MVLAAFRVFSLAEGNPNNQKRQDHKAQQDTNDFFHDDSPPFLLSPAVMKFYKNLRE
jgi:hypothetical protein